MKRVVCALIAFIMLFCTVACSPDTGDVVTDEVTTEHIETEPETTEE